MNRRSGGPAPDPAHTRQGNAFDLLRIAAAFTVLYSHSYPLMGLPEPQPVHSLTWGLLAVALFFGLSGFMVCQSWVHDPSLWRFALRRGLRIFPGLVMVALLAALVLGPWVSSLDVREYFRSSLTWAYLGKTILLLDLSPLPGVFEHNVYPVMVNGSLWTLPFEIAMYAVLALAGSLLPGAWLRAGCMTLLLLLLIAAGWLLLARHDAPPPAAPRELLQILAYSDVARLVFLGGFFCCGALLFLHAGRYPLSVPLAGALLAAGVAVPHILAFTLLLWIAVPYAAVVFAYRAPAALRRHWRHDYSYGVYIYAFPVQQVVALLALRHGFGWSVALPLSALLTLLLAALSWHWIERPALALKNRLLAPGTPALADPRVPAPPGPV